MRPIAKSTCDEIKNKLHESNKRNATQQELINQLRFSEERYKKTNTDLASMVEFERNRYYTTLKNLKTEKQTTDLLEKQQQQLLNQLESIASNDRKLAITDTVFAFVGGLIAGTGIVLTWETLWQLG